MLQPNHELRHLLGIQLVHHEQQNYRIRYHLVMYLCAAEYIRQTAGDGAGSASAEQNSTTQAGSSASAADSFIGTPLIPSGGVRYTVPQSVRLSHMEDTLLVRFRVGSVFTDAVLTVTAGDTCLLRQKKKKLAPGEMQQIILKKSAIPADAQSITICVAKEEG